MLVPVSKRKNVCPPSKVDYNALDRQDIEDLLDDMLEDILDRPRLLERGKKDEDIPTEGDWEDWAASLEKMATQLLFKRKLLRR